MTSKHTREGAREEVRNLEMALTTQHACTSTGCDSCVGTGKTVIDSEGLRWRFTDAGWEILSRNEDDTVACQFCGILVRSRYPICKTCTLIALKADD